LVLRFTHPFYISMYNPRMSAAIRDQKLRDLFDVLGGGEYAIRNRTFSN